ncbi:MAG: hypothetical protein CME64_11005 [Halobacteriovoraceae bacterium]|nr:hypothetical protein [Halobacteriovoraceae bacterium]|tara:strand:+ start:129883 stop:132318 length:2436 start_codon:yes stop_codon:yes gene_type:complete
MKTLIWDSGSASLHEFLDMAGRYIGIDLFEDLDDLAEATSNGSILLFDLDTERKKVEKKLKALKKSKVDYSAVFITEKMSPKEIAKHQKSKLGGDAYLKTPVDEDVFLSAMEPILGVNLKAQLEAKQKKIISEHQEDRELDEDTAILSSKLDDLFKETIGEAPEVTGHVNLEEFPELQEDNSEEGPEEEHQTLDLSEFQENESTGTEELSMADDNKEEGLDLGLDLGEDSSEESFSLSDNEDNAEEGLQFEAQESEGLVLDDLEIGSDSEQEVDGQNEGLELSNDESEIGLDLEQANELATDNGDSDHGLDLSLEDESGTEELTLGGEDSEELSLSNDDNDDSLSLSLSDEEEDSLSIDLGSGGEENSIAEESDEVGGLSLSEEDDLGLALEGSNGAEVPSEELDVSPTTGTEELSLGEESSDEEISFGAEEDLFEEDAGENELSLGEEAADEEISFGAEEDLLGDGGLDLGDEDLFGQDDSEDALSADSLPEVPSLEGGDDDMSPDAINKLAEIEQMMANENEGTPTSNLADQLNAEEEDFDPTMDEGLEVDATAGEDSTSFFKIGDQLGTEENQSLEAEAETTPPAIQSQSGQQTINDQKEIIASNEDEFARLGETIKHLRHDRQILMEKVEQMEQKVAKENKDFSNLQAELEEKRIEVSLLTKRKSKQLEDMSYRLELSEEKRMILEEKNKRLEQENENLRKKTSGDLNKIKSRERELENKLELLKADTDLQIKNRDFKILELKRKIDSLEFDMESIQLKEKKTVDNKYAMEERMERVINTLRRAIGELEEDEMPLRDLQKLKKNLDV